MQSVVPVDRPNLKIDVDLSDIPDDIEVQVIKSSLPKQLCLIGLIIVISSIIASLIYFIIYSE